MSLCRNSFELSAWIARPAAEVYAHLADPTNILGLQPPLVEMTPVSRCTVHGRPLLAYETVEAFRLGGLTVAHNRIAMRTRLRPGRHQPGSSCDGGLALRRGLEFVSG